MEPFEVAKTAQVATNVFKVAKQQGWLDRVRYALKKKHRVLVLGPTGVGKTNFLASLTSLTTTAIDHMSRTQFGKRHAIAIDNQPFHFVDTPGQLQHRRRRATAVREALGQGLSGAISVGSWGYHETATGKRNALAETGIARPEYLEAHRAIEIEMLGEWVDLLGDPANMSWLLTVVTKADLWWPERSAVLDHYRTGAYYEALGPARALSPSAMEYCSVIHRFYGEAPVSGLFDEDDRVRARAHLFAELITAVSRPS